MWGRLSILLFLSVSGPALAQGAAPTQDNSEPANEIVVTARDPAGLLERRPSTTVFGLSKPLLETPRAASFASALTLERYGVEGINDLVAISPGAFTDSYYGVAGSLNLRGTLAENYFRGFKRIENRGTYPTPLGAADQIDIVRGPPTPVFGPGKVGGYLDFTPKTARTQHGYLDQPTGEIEATLGDYGQKKLTGQVGLPAKIGGVQGGVYLYGEAADDPAYYRGIDPKHYLGQVSADFDLGGGWTMAFGGMLYDSHGAVQTPGWNRLTQALVDHGTYTTGRNTVLVDANHDGQLEPSELGGALETGYFGFTPSTDPRFVLNTGVGTTTLDRRTVFVSNADFSNTDTQTFYGDLSHDLGANRVAKLQVFYDALDNERYVSYGFPASYQAHVWEGRASILSNDVLLDGAIKAQTVLGLSYRAYDGRQRETFNGGYISLDRRDLSYGATATDIINDPFQPGAAALGSVWETDVHSRIGDAGAFAETDVKLPLGFDITGGARADSYHLVSRDDGAVVYGVTPGLSYRAGQGSFTWNAAVSWQSPWGLMPYVSYAHTAAPELTQAGGVSPNLIAEDAWLAPSNLREAGVKLRLFQDALTGSLSVYRQTRTQLGQNNAVVGTLGRGVELELRWVVDRHFSLTFAGNDQRTAIKGPDNSFIVIPPSTAGVSGVNGYGGAYVVYALSQLVPGNYTDTLIPRRVLSLYGTWTTDRHDWGRAGATLGATSVSRTAGVIPGAVRFPAYFTANGSVFYERGPWRVAANIDNLTDKLYFTPVADVYANVATLPSVGRTFRMSLRRSF
jgi:iron complex outermembrane receptor protein